MKTGAAGIASPHCAHDSWFHPSYPLALPHAVADSLAYSMHRGEFEAKTLRLLKRTRSALMYLCLAVHYEEKLKSIRWRNQMNTRNL